VALAIFGEITFDKGAEILTALDYFKGQHITLSVYSGGGDVFAATGIRDRMAQEDVTARVYGLAGSGAAFLLTGARRVEMAPFSSLMVHRAYKEDENKNKVYDKDTDNINAMQVEMFAQRTGKRRDVVEKWLASGDTFFSAQEAVDAGLADAIYSGDKMAASLNDMKPMSEVIKEAETPEVPVVETPAAEVPATPAVEDPGDEQVEVEIPITTGEAIKAALAGKFKAKVNISATYGKVIGELTDELRTVRASLDEANAQVEALAPKAAEAEAATAKAAEAEAKVAEVVKEVETLKATPIEEPVKPTSDANGVVPAGTAPKPTKASETAQAMARSMERLDRALGIQKN
jgi:ATP-dependent protease ClpP protease subunit